MAISLSFDRSCFRASLAISYEARRSVRERVMSDDGRLYCSSQDGQSFGCNQTEKNIVAKIGILRVLQIGDAATNTIAILHARIFQFFENG